MKTIGEQAQEYRISRGWNTTEMAAAVGTSRQNIESLEAKGNRNPRYLPDLAKAMGVTTDDLHKGKYSSQAKAIESAAQQPKPPVAEPIAPAPPPGAAPNYLSLDRLFNLLPNDPLVRAVVFQRASAVILDVINGRTGTTPAPVNTETHQKSDA